MDTILIVDDDRNVQKAMTRLFECEGYKVAVSGDGQSALESFRALPPAAVILDLGLPLMSGKDVCREIRRQSSSVPIIIVSATGQESDKILLLELGADDYVTKPFSPRELLARVRAAIRRSLTEKSSGSEYVEFGSARVSFGGMEASFKGAPVLLTAGEFKTLKCMVRRRTARGLKLVERIVRVNVSGLLVENYSPGT